MTISVYRRRIHTAACDAWNASAGTFTCRCSPDDLAALRARDAAREAELLEAASRAPWLRKRVAPADAVCPYCGDVVEQLISCRWCSETACDKPGCLANFHAETDPANGASRARPCPFAPEPEPTPHDGPEEPDITFGERKS